MGDNEGMADFVWTWSPVDEGKTVRHVRTREGSEKYGEPIGAPIRPNILGTPKFDPSQKLTADEATGASSLIRGETLRSGGPVRLETAHSLQRQGVGRFSVEPGGAQAWEMVASEELVRAREAARKPKPDAGLTDGGSVAQTEPMTPALKFTTHGRGVYSTRLNDREDANVIKDGRQFEVRIFETSDGVRILRDVSKLESLKVAKAYVEEYAAIGRQESNRAGRAIQAAYDRIDNA